jgi:NADH-quinone oxidoreductase subunit M
MGTPKPEFEDAHIHDVDTSEWIAWTPLLLGIVVFGLFPNLIFSVTNGAAEQITRAFSG